MTEPINLTEINCRSDKNLWKREEEEMHALSKNKTWELVDRSSNKNIVKCK